MNYEFIYIYIEPRAQKRGRETTTSKVETSTSFHQHACDDVDDIPAEDLPTTMYVILY